MVTINLLLIILAFACACAGVFTINTTFKQPNWIALSLAFYFASMFVRG